MRRNFISNFFINLVCHDFWRKLVALFLALLLYLAIAPRTSEKREKSFANVPVHIELPGNLVNNSDDIPRVEVTLSGDMQMLDNIDPGTLYLRTVVNSDAVIPGELYTLRLRMGDLNGLPNGVRVSSISPRELPLTLERLIHKRVIVKPSYGSQEAMSRDYEISNCRLVPASVVLSGSARVLDSIQEVSTNAIPLDEQVTDNFEYRTALRLPPGVRSDISEVDAHVEVIKSVVSQTFEVGPVRIIQSAEHTRKFKVSDPTPGSLTVELRGQRSLLGRMHSREISVTVNLDSITQPGSYDLPVAVSLPTYVNDITVQSFSPATVRVTVVQE